MGLFKKFKGEGNPERARKGPDPGPKEGPEVTLQGLVFKGEKGEPREFFVEGEPLAVEIAIKVRVPVFFDLNITLSIFHLPSQTLISKDNMQRDGSNITWLPEGEHLIEWKTSQLPLRQGSYSIVVELLDRFQPVVPLLIDSESHVHRGEALQVFRRRRCPSPRMGFFPTGDRPETRRG